MKKNCEGSADEEIRRFVANELGYDLGFELREIRNGYKFDVTCQGSVPIAIKAYLERSGHPAEEALRLAISMGGDSDTIGAMTAAIAGAKQAGFGAGLEGKCRALLPPDLLDINDRFEAFVNRQRRQPPRHADRQNQTDE